MKRIAIAALAMVMGLCLAGCSGMSKSEYKESPTVQYFTSGEFGEDLALLTASLPIDGEGELDYEAWTRLEDKCNALINMANVPDECAEAHAELVKAANSVLAQIDMIVECAANIEVYNITGDVGLLTDATEDLKAIQEMHEQALDYIKSSKIKLG